LALHHPPQAYRSPPSTARAEARPVPRLRSIDAELNLIHDRSKPITRDVRRKRPGILMMAGKGKGSSSFLKRRTKKLLLCSVRTVVPAALTNELKFFWFFFSKKNCFLPYPVSI
jgi:hypothetical protein